ncbi:hypothetical protein KHU50_009564 [Colletotrichum sp. SAR 10_65]|nr:hypothetical protein KHU50_009564 [Colletotrichum sp. SAR 10_65]KAI8211893.1 hypothetical protein K4K52_009239 [Colletotrichum sp. SAR 10_76]KAJ5004748.1 hypothetical protein K4K48_008980 [Colletotrichum sp. SAR 10_66]
MGLQNLEREGEDILRRTHQIQKQLFGSDDYRSVKTVDILSWYYSRVGREVEAASLIESVLRPRHSSSNGLNRGLIGPALKYEEGQEEEEEEVHLGDCGDGGDHDNDYNGLDYRRAGDQKKRKALEEWEDFITRSLSQDNFYARLGSLLAPPSYVWRDERLYLNDIDEIKWKDVGVADMLRNYPVCVILKDGEVRVRVPMASFADDEKESREVAALMKSVEESHFCEFLRSSGAVAGEEEAPETSQNLMSDSNYTSSSESSHEAQESKPDLTAPVIEQIFWGFPRELMGAEWQSSQVGSSFFPEWAHSNI